MGLNCNGDWQIFTEELRMYKSGALKLLNESKRSSTCCLKYPEVFSREKITVLKHLLDFLHLASCDFFPQKLKSIIKATHIF